MGGPVYYGAQAGWEGRLPLYLRDILHGGAPETAVLPGGKPETAAAGLHHDGSRTFRLLAVGEQGDQTNQPGTIPGADRAAHLAGAWELPGLRPDGRTAGFLRAEETALRAAGWPGRSGS